MDLGWVSWRVGKLPVYYITKVVAGEGTGGLGFQIELHNAEVRKKLHSSLLVMDPTMGGKQASAAQIRQFALHFEVSSSESMLQQVSYSQARRPLVQVG